MGSCCQADGMERKELLLFTRIYSSLSIQIYFHLIGHKKDPDFLHCSAENNNLQFPRMKAHGQDSLGMSSLLWRLSVGK